MRSGALGQLWVGLAPPPGRVDRGRGWHPWLVGQAWTGAGGLRVAIGPDGYWHPCGRIGRVIRVAAFAAVSLGLAVAAHVAGGGHRPPPAVANVAFGALMLLGWLASRRERTGRQIAALVIGSQAVLHVVFVLRERMAGPAGSRASLNLASLFLCHHGSTPISSAQVKAATAGIDLSSLTTLARHTTPTPPPGWLVGWAPAAMIAAHLLAATVVAWWLRRGERALWTAACRVVRTLLGGLRSAGAPLCAMLVAQGRSDAAVPQVHVTRWGSRAPPRHIVHAFA